MKSLHRACMELTEPCMKSIEPIIGHCYRTNGEQRQLYIILRYAIGAGDVV